MSSMRETAWSSAEIIKLKLLAKEGLTFKQIGIELKRSRSSVAGSISRYIYEYKSHPKLPSNKSPARISDTPDRAIFKTYHRKALPKEKRLMRHTVAFPPADGHCRSVTGDPRALRCCGLPCKHGSVWCESHHRVYMVPVEVRVR